MSDLFTAPEPAAGAPRPKRPAKTRKAGLPPLSGAWYGPQERVWLIPHPFLPDQPYRIRLSSIIRADECAFDLSRCFLIIAGVSEPLLVGVSAAVVREHAWWAFDPKSEEQRLEMLDRRRQAHIERGRATSALKRAARGFVLA
jgi:hypothetical protein